MAAPLQDFALIAEGVTDQAVLTNVLLGFFKETQREPSITSFHPVLSEQEKHGGWPLLLKSLQMGRHREAFQFSQYVVVQVDTDDADKPGFDVARHGPDGPLALEAFVENVVARLKAAIGEEDLRAYDGRFLFAVTVEQTECWLLPLWFNDENIGRTTGCFTRLLNCSPLRNALKRGQAFNKDALLYQTLSKDYRKRKVLLEKGPQNPSLRIFLDALETHQIVLPPVD